MAIGEAEQKAARRRERGAHGEPRLLLRQRLVRTSAVTLHRKNTKKLINNRNSNFPGEEPFGARHQTASEQSQVKRSARPVLVK